MHLVSIDLNFFFGGGGGVDCQGFTLAATFPVPTRNGKCSTFPTFAKDCFCSSDYSHHGTCEVVVRYLSHSGFHLHFHEDTIHFSFAYFHLRIFLGRITIQTIWSVFVYVTFLLIYCGNIPSPYM